MSPLWRDELRVVLSPSGVDAIRLKRGLRPVVDQRMTIACESPAAPERSVVDALAAVLKEQRAIGKVRVVLSNHFMRYLLLPWHPEIANPNEWVTLARLRFKEVYGSVADGWDVRLAIMRYGTPQLACATDRTLLDDIDRTFAQHKVHLESLRPALTVVYNRWRGTLGKAGCWFALYEGGRLSVCRVDNGAWSSIANARTAEQDVLRELKLLIEREALLLPPVSGGGNLVTFAPTISRDEIRAIAGFKVSMLDALSGSDRRYALALAS